ncbi:MAG TPA: glycosyltransferase family 4 protein [Vicinamibacterales bacterium]|nr:glycosyltransferase family 4 protein [Vicinamibacterales bacterium]
MRILLATDAFPPVCGGSGWSTFELARGLRARGHEILVVQPRQSASGASERRYDDLRVVELGFGAPAVPFLRNYWKNERLWPRVARDLARLIAESNIDLIHAQHVLTTVPSVEAARAARIPAVATVRDYWPVCYWSDLIHTRADEAGAGGLCPACTSAGMQQCLRARTGAAWPLALPFIPYMRGNLSRKRTALANADAVIAVSTRMAADLRARAPELAATPLTVVPNAVDIDALLARAAVAPRRAAGPYAIYLGKLAPNKGTRHLVDVIERAGLDWPLVVAGDGPDRTDLEARAARSTRTIRFVGWIDRDDTIAWLAHASLLIFPSRGPESLSRVLLDGSALGLPIAAMNTGGTADIVEHGVTGLLSDTPAALADDVRRLREDEGLRARVGRAAQARARERFDAPRVIDRIEEVYARATARARSTRGSR